MTQYLCNMLLWGILALLGTTYSCLYLSSRDGVVPSGAKALLSASWWKSLRLPLGSGESARTVVAVGLLPVVSVLAAMISLRVSMLAIDEVSCVELGFCFAAVLAAALIDQRMRLIPNALPLVIVVARVCAVPLMLLTTPDALKQLFGSILACLICLLILTLGNVVSKGGIGAGDIKLLCALGLCGGFYLVLYTTFFALVVCLVASLILIRTGRADRHSQLPFAPFVFVGLCVALSLGMY